MTRRSRGREVALQVLYQVEQNASVPLAEVRRFIQRRLLADRKLCEFTEGLIAGVKEHQVQIDALISEAAENWRLDRMAAIDRNILRLGAYEMMYCREIPARVAINEALELAKRYSTAQSSRFVNGILDRVLQSQSQPARPDREPDSAESEPEPGPPAPEPGVGGPHPRSGFSRRPGRRRMSDRPSNRPGTSTSGPPPRCRGGADLHVHTTHSDGSCSPCEVVVAASRVGLGCGGDHRPRHGLGPGRGPARGASLGRRADRWGRADLRASRSRAAHPGILHPRRRPGPRRGDGVAPHRPGPAFRGDGRTAGGPGAAGGPGGRETGLPPRRAGPPAPGRLPDPDRPGLRPARGVREVPGRRTAPLAWRSRDWMSSGPSRSSAGPAASPRWRIHPTTSASRRSAAWPTSGLRAIEVDGPGCSRGLGRRLREIAGRLGLIGVGRQRFPRPGPSRPLGRRRHHRPGHPGTAPRRGGRWRRTRADRRSTTERSRPSAPRYHRPPMTAPRMRTMP